MRIKSVTQVALNVVFWYCTASTILSLFSVYVLVPGAGDPIRDYWLLVGRSAVFSTVSFVLFYYLFWGLKITAIRALIALSNFTVFFGVLLQFKVMIFFEQEVLQESFYLIIFLVFSLALKFDASLKNTSQSSQ
jgi:hypothetical protein